ncbi:MAG TPA: methyltransferase domain-containing protein [Allosphingosinicella sp.]|jgi:SAM-dependent methyltransferase
MRTAIKQAVKSRVSETMKGALASLAFELKTKRIAKRAMPSFRSLQGRRDIKVHLGAGDDIKLGWVNIDLALRIPPQIDPAAHPDTMFINYDLRQGLPLPPESCAYIYSAHFFEHLEYQQGVRLIADCYRALKPGGVFRTALPNYEGLFRAYLDRDESYFDLLNMREILPYVEPGTESFVDHVNYGVYQHGEHKCVYDAEKFVLLLRKAGFSQAEAKDYEQGTDQPSELRRRYSFYVEAVK